MECSICLNTITSKSRVTCPYCTKGIVCYKCNYTNLKVTAPESGCSLCKTAWSRIVLCKILTNKDYNSYITICNNASIKKEKDTIDDSAYLIPHIKEMDLLSEEYSKIILRAQDIKDRLFESQKRISFLKPNQYRFKCPSKCPGWIDEENEYCTVCCNDVCPKCITILNPNKSHKCNEQERATIEEIKLNTRACPKCYINIGKTEGCSTMYCTNCNTAFDWYSLEVVKGKFHNPEHQKLVKEGKVKKNTEDRYIGEYKFTDYDVEEPFSMFVSYYNVLESLFTVYTDMLEECYGFIRMTKARKLMKVGTETEFLATLTGQLNKKDQIIAILGELNKIKTIIENSIEFTSGLDYVSTQECYNRVFENIQNIAKTISGFLHNSGIDDPMMESFLMTIIYNNNVVINFLDFLND